MTRRGWWGGPLRAAVLLIAAFFGGCDTGAPTRARGVLVITVDGMRADALERLAERGALARFAQGAVVFEDAWTPSPLLLPAHASLLSGKDPYLHGARDDGATSLSVDTRNLAEILAADGFRARASVASSDLAAGGGLERGFETYLAPQAPPNWWTMSAERRADGVLDDALADLVELARGREGFLYLLTLAEPAPPFSPPDVMQAASSKERYAGELRTVDRELGRLFEMLGNTGLLDELIIVVTAPRGCDIAAELPAGEDLALEAIRVPLLLRAPGLEPKRVSGNVSLTDVAPTVLALLGVPPPGDMTGRDLTRSIEDGRTAPGYTIAIETWHPWLAHGASPMAAALTDDLMVVRAAEVTLRDLKLGTETVAPRDARATALLAEIERRFGEPLPTDSVNDGSQIDGVIEARLLLAAGATGSARTLLSDLTGLAPGDPTAARLFCAILLGGTQVKANALALAEPLVEFALQRRPDDPALNALLAKCAESRQNVAARAMQVAIQTGHGDTVDEAKRRIAQERKRRIAALERALARSPESEALQQALENARR